MRQWLMAVVVGGLVVPVSAAEPGAGTATHPVAATMMGDAALADVCFVGVSTGWAVGERGVIWHTNDGGATWVQQASPVTCGLSSVCFLDAQNGWAVGGASRPYSAATQGVVLRTADGGRTWTSIPRLLLPRLTRVQFFTASNGVAIGDGSSFFPSGVFITRDGGRSWQPLPTDVAGQWLAGDFVDAGTGAVAGAAGQFATVVERQVAQSPLASASSRAFRAMRLVSPTGGWLVGDGGLVMTTGDLGRSWQSLQNLPGDVFGHFDFRAVAVRGSHVWLAGSPGTRVLHSADGGQSWQAFATGQNVPLDALTFVDDMHGWAVGELGSILATRDGGQTWQVQRAGGQRAALVAVFADAADVPLELIAEQGAADGYLTSVKILHPTSRRDAGRTREAMLLAGATAADTAWRFPPPPEDLALGPNDLLNMLNRANDGRALDLLENHLVRELRMWRPDVVVTHRARSESDKPIAALVEQIVLQAIEAAADPTRTPELSTNAGLAPWQVKRAYGVLPVGSRGDETISTGRFTARLGGSLADWSAPARRLLADESALSSATDSIELELLVNRAATADGPWGLFGGIALTPGGEARRPTANGLVGDVDDMRKLATRRKHLRELMERSEGNAAWVGQVEKLIGELDVAGSGELLFQLAAGYRQRGRLDLAADTYYLLVRRYPDHPLADQSLVWLVQYYASSEAGRRAKEPEVVDRRQVERLVENGARAAGGEGVEQASAAAPIGPDAAPAVGLSSDDRRRRAVQLGEYLEATRPLIFAEPAVRFSLVAAERQLGFANPAKRYFLTLGQLPENDPWRRCAVTEQWLTKPGESPPPKALGHCRRASERPHLDGRLNELFWTSADALSLKGERNDVREAGDVEHKETDKIVRPTVRLTYDAEFLYLAVECPKVAGGDYRAEGSPRPRDADLSQHDRVALRLDVDRDYATSFELVVDHRGWTHESCWGEKSWNPTWFVAAAEDAEAWTIEAAVPLRELMAEPPAARHVWAAAVRRTIPRVGYETWAGDVGQEDSPESFGLLIFE